MKNEKKNPVEKRTRIQDWKNEQKIQAVKALEVAKSQNKPIRYLLKK